MMRLILKLLVSLLAGALLVAWMLTAYSRAEDPNLIPMVIPINENIFAWLIRVSTSMIYFMLMDLLYVLESPFNIMRTWLITFHEFIPIIKLGILVILGMGAVILRYWFRSRQAAIKPARLLKRLTHFFLKQPVTILSNQQLQSPKVFISYSHDSQEHKDRILKLADQLCDDGVDCNLDQYDPNPEEGWTRWMKNHLQEADFVLVICTETYYHRFEGREEPGKGLGVKWEGAIITREIYENDMSNKRFIPVIFINDGVLYIPDVLRDYTRYQIDNQDDYEGLLRLLTQQPRVVKKNIGKPRPMPPIN